MYISRCHHTQSTANTILLSVTAIMYNEIKFYIQHIHTVMKLIIIENEQIIPNVKFLKFVCLSALVTITTV